MGVHDLGFASEPERLLAPKGGLKVYRAWGGRSTEWGTGFFSLEKPTSVLDAELRFNIADWGNMIWFVSTFRILENVPYLKGPVLHGGYDLSKRGTQIYVLPQYTLLVRLLRSKEVLKQDVSIQPGAGTA
jgi:hypothetical protein